MINVLHNTILIRVKKFFKYTVLSKALLKMYSYSKEKTCSGNLDSFQNVI